MIRLADTDFFYYSTPLEADARANYVFIQDFEDHLTDSLNPRKTKTAVYAKEMEMAFSGERMEKRRRERDRVWNLMLKIARNEKRDEETTEAALARLLDTDEVVLGAYDLYREA